MNYWPGTGIRATAITVLCRECTESTDEVSFDALVQAVLPLLFSAVLTTKRILLATTIALASS